MITGFLSLLCLGFCLGYEVELENEKLSKPSLNALPGPVVKRSRNVTLRCQGHFQNVTFMLGKLQDPGYRQEQNSAGYHAEFLLTDLEPKNAGTYFCAYKTMGSHGWSQKSEYLQLEVTASIHKQKCFCGNCGIQHHMPRDPGGVSPTCASGNRQIDLGTSCGTCRRPSPVPAPLGCGPRAPEEHRLGQLPVDESTFV
ncbi:V-set and transmembrane domain-containing protein 1-like isoform 3-T3 [Molossus nigricans]